VPGPGRTGGRTRGVRLLGAVALGAAFTSTGRSQQPTAAAQFVHGSFPGGRYFNVTCGFSHRNNDDPILHPGHRGRSHNHTYIGNRSVDASSTPAALRGGETTCDNPADSSTYWVPTLYVGREPTPEPVACIALAAYYEVVVDMSSPLGDRTIVDGAA
jgi:hypothetical protein